MEDREGLVKAAFRLECMTAGWLLIESVAALWLGVAAHSLTLIAFGADSVIELLSAGLLLWRLHIELREREKFSEEIEDRASKIGAILLAALTIYVLVNGAWGLWRGEGQAFSLSGLILAALTIPIMYALDNAKLKLAGSLGSASLRADAAESIACGYLSAAVLVGLLAQWATGAWWVDGVSALALTPFLIKEAREAWKAAGD